MLETAATTAEMHRHYACAHAHRAAAFRAIAVWAIGLFRHEKGPRHAAQPFNACAAC